MNTSVIGQRLRELRTARGITLRQLADRIGVHFTSLSNAERGRYAFGPETLTRLAEELGAEADLLLAEAGHRQLPFRVLGDVAAGVPIDAVEDVETFDLADEFDPATHYLLRVKGDSMIEDGILNGDLAIIRHTSEPQAGQTVVAVIDGGEATLKRFRRQGHRITLIPANQHMQPIQVTADRLEIRGVLAGLLRLRVS